MISWWWLIPAFIVGMMAGIFYLGLCSASKNGNDDSEERK